MNLPIIILVTSFLICIGIAYRHGLTKERILIAFLVSNGISLIFGGLSHIFVPKIVADNIGWQTSKNFQYEIGIANIILGILCVSTIYYRGNWILSAILATSLWGWGNAIGHLLSWKNEGNTKEGNIGWVFYLDIFLPIISIILYYNYKK